MIPSKEKCFELIKEMEMMPHIVDHSLQVCRVALFLTDELKRKDIFLNQNLIMASALLHDITKTRSFKTGENHAATGQEYLEEKGYPEVANIVGQHVKLNGDDHFKKPDEALIVNYSDKRVLHDKITSLQERMTYIMERYGLTEQHKQRIQLLWKEADKIEMQLFKLLSFKPIELKERVLSYDQED